MFVMIFWVWSDKYIAWMWITMNKSWNKNLLSEGSDKVVHNCLLVESVFFHFLIISYLESIDPLRDHYAFSWILTKNCGNIKFLSFYINYILLNCSKFFLPLIEFSVYILKSNYFWRLAWMSSTNWRSGKSKDFYRTKLMSQCMNISDENCFLIFGFWILTATNSPLFSLPRCTWASEAEAIGSF